MNIPEFTVLEFSRSLKRVIEDSFGYVRIKGEVTGFKRAASGHLYFSLKEEDVTLTAVCFKNMADLIDFDMNDGLQITALGRVTTFAGRSNYQIIVEKVEISGIGAILEMIEKRRQKLASEGLFDVIHKKQIPFFPTIIGVITSETGAVIQDILHRVQARCATHIQLYPSAVQGKDASKNIIKALQYFGKQKIAPDVIIIARGGGSFEDLLPFNDEDLVRAVFACDIPIISAVGHETDTTLIDFVADLRAPTPTAAAEIATPVLADLKVQIEYYHQKINNAPNIFLDEQKCHLEYLQKFLINPSQILENVTQNLGNLSEKIKFLIKNNIENKNRQLSAQIISSNVILYKINLAQQKIEYICDATKSKLQTILKNHQIKIENLTKLLDLGHYKKILNRGFALVKNQKGDLIHSINEVKTKEEITVEIADGEFKSYVLNLDKLYKNKEKSTKMLEIIQPDLI